MNLCRAILRDRKQRFLACGQVLIEGCQQRRIACMLRHQINEVNKISLAENLQRAGVGLRADVMLSEKFTAKLDQNSLFFGEACYGSTMAYEFYDRGLQSVLECRELVHGPLILGIMFPGRNENH